MKLLHEYQNGNTKVQLYQDGTKIREWPDGEESIVEYPESCDLKITNWCNMGMDGAGMCNFCFLPGNKVANYRNNNTLYNFKNIENIKIGDTVISFNEEKNIQEEKKVVRLFSREVNETVYSIDFHCGVSITVTGNHKVYTQRGIIRVDELKNTDSLTSLFIGPYLYIKSISPFHYSGIVYNIEVEDNHNYYVEGCLVSNCHEQSNLKGKHGDLDLMADIWDTALPGTEIACLSGNTRVGTERGMMKLSELQIGEKVYDERGNLVEVVNITKTNKPAIKLQLNKGISFISSKDHPFIVENEQICAESTKNKIMDNAYMSEWENKTKTIDMANYVTISQELFGRSGIILEDKIKINHTSIFAKRHIELNKDLMWLYGITVAEGSKRSIVLHREEGDIAERAINTYSNLFFEEAKSNVKQKKNALIVEFHHSAYYERLFFDAMKIGRGARNKSIEFLFGLDKELIRSALFGMFQGDGSFRKRKQNKNKSQKEYTTFSLTYKTTSEKMAKELVFLLSTVFDVQSSIYYGKSPKRKIEGREIESTDYYKIDIYGKNNIRKLFDIFDDDVEFQKQTDDFRLKTKKYYVKNITDAEEEVLYDIQLEEGSSHLFVIDGGIVTHNCGGGDTLSHPHIEKFLKRVTKNGCIPNVTVNTLHINKQAEQIRQYQEENLVYGIGISYRGKEYMKRMPKNIKYDNVVFHMILGLNDDKDCQAVIDWCKDNQISPKLLFLGYKQYGNGSDFYEKNPWLEGKLEEWKKSLLKKVMKNNGTFSFDNLAISQLDMQNQVSKKTWEQFYQGTDGTHTFYIDAVKEEVARTSTTKERFKVQKGDTLKDLFGKVKVSSC